MVACAWINRLVLCSLTLCRLRLRLFSESPALAPVFAQGEAIPIRTYKAPASGQCCSAIHHNAGTTTTRLLTKRWHGDPSTGGGNSHSSQLSHSPGATDKLTHSSRAECTHALVYMRTYYRMTRQREREKKYTTTLSTAAFGSYY